MRSRSTRPQLGKNLREARRASGLSQASVGRIINATDQYVSDLERGRSVPSLRFLALLSFTYDVPVARLLAGVRAAELMKG